MSSLKVLELYSGIGGMHLALKESGINADIIEAADINTVANLVYHHNFPNTKINNKNLLSLTAKFIDELEVDMILMSPPCQPYTRLGKKEDTLDRRSDSLSHLIDIIPEVSPRLRYILLENVKGFEKSDSRNNLMKSLKPSFFVVEFLLNPLQFGIPNSRERYYLLARRESFLKPELSEMMVTDPSLLWDLPEGFSIKDILDIADDAVTFDKYLVPDDVLFKRAMTMDIVTKECKRSCCFTKAYGRYIEGTGSIYCPFDISFIKNVFEKVKITTSDVERQNLLLSLKLRFFSPKEISNLMCFSGVLNFPEGVTNRQKYNLLGNSINVKVVSYLIQFLVSN